MKPLTRAFLATLLLAVLSACSGNPRPAGLPVSPEPPDTSSVLRLSARSRSASGCPISPNVALTSAHVVLTEREFYRVGDFDDQPFMFVWATRDDAQTGKTGRVQADRYADLSFIESVSGPFPHWYAIAPEKPEVGEQVWFIGFSFESRRSAFSERLFTARVLRFSAGRIVMDRPGVPGSSGSCILNALGQVVGVNAGGVDLESGQSVGIGISVAGLEVPVVPAAWEERVP